MGLPVFRVGSLISHRQPVTVEEVKMTLERPMTFKSVQPFAITVMQDSYVYTSFFMCFPTWFVRQHLPKENVAMTVWDPTGKPWKIMYICYASHGALSGGWGKFSRADNLEKHDTCVFELIKDDELRVHVYRAVEEINSTINSSVVLAVICMIVLIISCKITLANVQRWFKSFSNNFQLDDHTIISHGRR